MDYLDFNLEIRPGGPEKYPVSVDSPGGEALQEMRFPFDDWELKNQLLSLENALLRSGGSHRSISSQEQTVRDFGERLFKAVLTGDVKTRYEMSLREAKQQNKGLRLKLRIQPPKLALLPWEFLYDPDGGEYLCFSSSTPLVRYVDLGRPVEQLPVKPPLRILGMVVSPTDLPQLDVDKEKRLVEESIKVLQAKGLVELNWLEEQTWSAFQEAMWGGPWHIFHFVGHGDFDQNSGEGRVAFSDEAGREDVLGARKLARLLDDHSDLRLAFLNSCEGARGSEGDPFSGTAATLVRRGVPAVLAMQYQITDNAAIAFSRAFYHAVANNLPVDAAVAAARTAVSMYDTLEWGTPVLYMRSPDGRLFDIKSGDREEEEPLRRYREVVEKFWTSGELHEREVEKLKNIADNEPSLTSSTAADIEREVMGETKETLLERLEQAAKEQAAKVQYRKAVEEVWADNEVSDAETQRLFILASELSLTTDITADIEREVTGDTFQAIIQHQTEEEVSRKYREAIEWVWTDEDLNERQVRKLGNLADRLKLNASIAAAIEQDVMGDTKETILQRQEQANRERARKERLEGLYDRARSFHRDQDWQAVIGVFDQIHAEDPTYPDTERLLASAPGALVSQGVARKDPDPTKAAKRKADDLGLDLSQVKGSGAKGRITVQDVSRTARELHEREVEKLKSSADNEPSLTPSTTADDEREIRGETKEALLERRDQTAEEQYRRAVQAAWVDSELSDAEAEQLRTLASELGLSSPISADIEYKVMGGTVKAGFQRKAKLSIDDLRRVCAKYPGSGYFVHDQIPSRKEANARSAMRIPKEQSVVALFDNTVFGGNKDGIVITGDGIYWRNSAGLEPGWMPWSEFASVQIKRSSGFAGGVQLGDFWLSSAARRFDADQAIAVFREIQSLVKYAEDPTYPDTPDGRILDITTEKRPTEPREAAEHAAETRKREQEEQLEELYEQASRLHQNQEWRAVIDVFARIHAEDPAYPDSEGLLASARERVISDLRSGKKLVDYDL